MTFIVYTLLLYTLSDLAIVILIGTRIAIMPILALEVLLYENKKIQ